MQITYFPNNKERKFNGTMTGLIKKLKLKDRCYIMYTLTTRPNSMGTYQFRAWIAPFANFCSSHVDTGETEKVFQIFGKSPEEILKAVAPLLVGKEEWKPVTSYKVRLWLAWDSGS